MSYQLPKAVESAGVHMYMSVYLENTVYMLAAITEQLNIL